MANQETNMKNWAETTLTAEFGPTALTAVVSTTTALPTSPCYLIIEPDSPTQREVILFDGSFTATNLVTTVIGNRYLAGSAAGSGLTHPIDSVVRHAPVAQHFEDINDRMDVVTQHDALAGLGDDDHPQYIKDAEYTAKGDILAGTGSGTFAKITVGGNDQILVADSADAEGIVWKTPDPGIYLPHTPINGSIYYGSGQYVYPYYANPSMYGFNVTYPHNKDEMIYTPCIVQAKMTVANFALKVGNGTYPTGVKAAVYAADHATNAGFPGTRVSAVGEHTGAWTANTAFDFSSAPADFTLEPGLYWVGVILNSAGATANIHGIYSYTTFHQGWQRTLSTAWTGTASWPALKEITSMSYTSGPPASANASTADSMSGYNNAGSVPTVQFKMA